MAGDGDAGPAGDDILDVFAGDDAGGGVVEVVLVAQGAQVLALFALLVGVEARLLELVIRDGESMRCTMNLMRFCTSVSSSGSEVWRSLTRAPASSMRSMALSGRKRSGM
jgi:hypothetical protein